MTEAEQAKVALDEIGKAWATCREIGVSEHVLRTATLTAAIANFVGDAGEEVTAQIMGLLPEKIRNGDFSPVAPAGKPAGGHDHGGGCGCGHDH
ncbi:MAG TPA: hypothetical protein VEB64_08875 [Azospirillaceae bacterium]|nr:hypothetical protein [Azospirillaceae bacterium]